VSPAQRRRLRGLPIVAIAWAALLGGCGGGGGQVRVASPVFDDLARGLGVAGRQLDEALTVGRDDLTRLRGGLGVTDDAIGQAARQLDDRTPLAMRVTELTEQLGSEEAATITDLACRAYDAGGWETMEPAQQHAWVNSWRPGLAGDAWSVAGAVGDLVAAMQNDGSRLEVDLSRIVTCQLAGMGSTLP
jgi:hypothetical protein